MVRLKLNQKLVIAEKDTKAIYFVVVGPPQHGGNLKLDIKGVLNINFVNRLTIQVYDINRFCRYHNIYDFHDYYEEYLADKELTNKSTQQEMTFEDLENMMEKPHGYLMIRMNGKKKYDQKDYEYERSKYLSLMHLAVNLNDKELYAQWCQAYENTEAKWKTYINTFTASQISSAFLTML